MSRPLLDAALDYAGMGYAVLPLRERGKAPLTDHGVKDATTDVDQIRSWWDRRPCANIGLAIPPGYLVLDLDNSEALLQLRGQDLPLPTTATATTGRGQHLWYATGEAAVCNRVSLFPNVDIRAPGGYIVAPPSIHPSGTRYRWKVALNRSAIAEAPEWLLGLLTGPAHSVKAEKRDWLQVIAEPVPEGRRNQALAQVSGLLFRFLQANIAAELAYCWAQVKLRPPLPEQEVRRTIESVAGLELKRRQGAA